MKPKPNIASGPCVSCKKEARFTLKCAKCGDDVCLRCMTLWGEQVLCRECRRSWRTSDEA